MTEEEFKEILATEETDTVEFKSWINARNVKEIISLAVDELIAFANTKGGTVYFGVEDKPIEVTGCDRSYDQAELKKMGTTKRSVKRYIKKNADETLTDRLIIEKAIAKIYLKMICNTIYKRVDEDDNSGKEKAYKSFHISGRVFGIERHYRDYISMYKNKENYRKESCTI